VNFLDGVGLVHGGRVVHLRRFVLGFYLLGHGGLEKAVVVEAVSDEALGGADFHVLQQYWRFAQLIGQQLAQALGFALAQVPEVQLGPLPQNGAVGLGPNDGRQLGLQGRFVVDFPGRDDADFAAGVELLTLGNVA